MATINLIDKVLEQFDTLSAQQNVKLSDNNLSNKNNKSNIVDQKSNSDNNDKKQDNNADLSNYSGPITAAIRHHEWITPTYGIFSDVENIHWVSQSKYQDIRIIESKQFGRTLILDYHTQSSEFDEHLYHESLVHPSMIAHNNPKTIFVGGGGELAAVREILKYKSVEKVIMVDLDEQVVEASLKKLPQMVSNVIKDKRLKIEYGDAKKYLEQCEDNTFDIIIMDVSDPIESGPAVCCYWVEFYQSCYNKLTSNGIIVTQSGPAGFTCIDECFCPINNTLRQVFNDVLPYIMEVPCFGTKWGWNIGFKQNAPKWFQQKYLNINDINEQIEIKLGKDYNKILKHYDGESHLHMFYIPKYMRELIAKETKVMSKDSKVFMY